MNLLLVLLCSWSIANADTITIGGDLIQFTTVPYFMIENFGKIQPNSVVTDSVIWRTVKVDSLNLGNGKCQHKWVYSETRRAGGSFCAVYHNGFHCDYDDMTRNRICRKCLRKETQREFWYQHRNKPPETEYDKLEKKLKSSSENNLCRTHLDLATLPFIISSGRTIAWKDTLGVWHNDGSEEGIRAMKQQMKGGDAP